MAMPKWARAAAKAGLAGLATVAVAIVTEAVQVAVEGFIKDKLGDEAKTRRERDGK